MSRGWVGWIRGCVDRVYRQGVLIGYVDGVG